MNAAAMVFPTPCPAPSCTRPEGHAGPCRRDSAPCRGAGPLGARCGLPEGHSGDHSSGGLFWPRDGAR